MTAIAQDAAVFLWCGTIDGLNKFVGYHFTVYRHGPSDSTVIAGGWITALYQAKDGTIWIGTLVTGSSKFEGRTGRFSNYRLDTQLVDSSARQRLVAALPFTCSYLNHYTIKAICVDAAGNIWIGTFGRGFDRLDLRSQRSTHLTQDNGLHNNVV